MAVAVGIDVKCSVQTLLFPNNLGTGLIIWLYISVIYISSISNVASYVTIKGFTVWIHNTYSHPLDATIDIWYW